MNDIEQKFYDAFIKYNPEFVIKSQAPIGIYIADFVLYPDSTLPVAVEIDGHEYHKTKEQRLNDYRRERFFMKEGYIVIRFMASEVFVDAERCVDEAHEIIENYDIIIYDNRKDEIEEYKEKLIKHIKGER